MKYIKYAMSLISLLSTTMVFANGVIERILAVGSETKENVTTNIILTSKDGVKWSPVVAPKTPKLTDGVVAQNKFTVTTNCGFLLTSKQGINWTATPTLNCADRIIWSHDLYFTLYHDTKKSIGTILMSMDGLKVKNNFAVPGATFKGVTRGKGMYVAVATLNDSNAIYLSDIGNKWEKVQAILPKGKLNDITYSNGFVAVGSYIATSPDGYEWSTIKNPLEHDLNSVIYANSLFVAVGNKGSIITSDDGTHWNTIESKTENNLNKITWTVTNNQFVVVGDAGTILTSPDGKHWTLQTSGTTINLTGVAGRPHL